MPVKREFLEVTDVNKKSILSIKVDVGTYYEF